MKCKKLLCMLLAALMLLGLTACGNKPSDPNLLKVGDYTLLYKGERLTLHFDCKACEMTLQREAK